MFLSYWQRESSKAGNLIKSTNMINTSTIKNDRQVLLMPRTQTPVFLIQVELVQGLSLLHLPPFKVHQSPRVFFYLVLLLQETGPQLVFFCCTGQKVRVPLGSVCLVLSLPSFLETAGQRVASSSTAPSASVCSAPGRPWFTKPPPPQETGFGRLGLQLTINRYECKN